MHKLYQDLKEIITEYSFTERWARIERMWEIGKRICEDKTFKVEQITPLSIWLGEDEEEIKNAILFYKKFPDLDILPDGKAVNWWSIKEKYL